MIFNAYTDSEASAFPIALKSCGHIFAENGRAIHRPRGREDWLLFYVAKGLECFTLDCEALADEGSFILFSPGEKQEHVCISEKTSEFYYVHFTVSGETLPTALATSTVYRAKPSAKVRDLFEEMLSETESKLPYYETVALGSFLSILGHLERSVSAQSGETHTGMDRIAVVLRRMNREFAGSHTLDDFAAMCRMSKFHFLRVFRAVTGVSPVEYRNRIRIEHAKELLLESTLSVSEIGAEVGYASPAYFCDAFKKAVGVSPSRYRETDGRGVPDPSRAEKSEESK